MAAVVARCWRFGVGVSAFGLGKVDFRVGIGLMLSWKEERERERGKRRRGSYAAEVEAEVPQIAQKKVNFDPSMKG